MTTIAADNYKPRPRLSQRSAWIDLIETVVLIVVVYALVNLATIRFFIDGPSMQPTFEPGQFVLVSRVHYLFGEPQRGEIVVFNAPGSRPNDPPLIKRLVGLPGETLALRGGQVYIDGVLLEEPYLREACTPARCSDRIVELGEDEYFLMGDNRNNSRDSRAFGAVTRDRIVGEAILRYLPLDRLGLVKALNSAAE
ncbi:MAG: signal peptidase I [Phototrophicales bacterium]|nr:MAG: signal peptidase I [Phototrophicales bacterium]